MSQPSPADKFATNEYFSICSSKKTSAVQNYFEYKRFDGNTTQSIYWSLRDYEVCVKQLRLNAQQNHDLFLNVFDSPTRDYFYDSYSDDIKFTQFACVVAREYGSSARRLVVQSELELLTFENFTTSQNISDEATGLSRLV